MNLIGNVIEKILQLLNKKKREGFSGIEDNIRTLLVFSLLLVLVYLILLLLFGKVLWNSCLCELLPVKKCRSVWHILGLMILLGLLLPSSSK